MIEWLKDNRVLLYKAQFTRDDKKAEYQHDFEKPTVEWKLHHRMKFIETQYGCKDFLEQVSPEFTKFVAIDYQKGNYLIRDMLSEEILYNIPPHIMKWESHPSEMML